MGMIGHKNEASVSNMAQPRDRLAALCQWFNTAPPVGSQLHVNYASHNEDGEQEYIWMSVSRWIGHHIEGFLTRDSTLDERLCAGTKVSVPESMLHEWLVASPGGRSEQDGVEPLSLAHG